MDSLNVACRCGFSPNARQIRCTVGADTPVRLEPLNRTQWARRFLDDERPLLERLSGSLGRALQAQLGELEKARELLVDAQAALEAMPAGMDLFIYERATHHRNALALGEGPKGSTKSRNLRAQAQRWFRDHAARGYACFSGFGL